MQPRGPRGARQRGHMREAAERDREDHEIPCPEDDERDADLSNWTVEALTQRVLGRLYATTLAPTLSR
jgi:hypothetical protein